MDIGTLSFYDENAERLSALYECADMSHFYKTVDDLLHGEGCVLDIGCGDGRDIRALGCRGYDVCGCDACKGMVKCAQTKDLSHACLLWTRCDVDWEYRMRRNLQVVVCQK